MAVIMVQPMLRWECACGWLSEPRDTDEVIDTIVDHAVICEKVGFSMVASGEIGFDGWALHHIPQIERSPWWR